jgi:hypothetical protein
MWGLGQAQQTLGNTSQARKSWRRSIEILTEIGELDPDHADLLLRQPIPRTPEIIKRNT